MRFNYMMFMVLVLVIVLVGGCAPIEGIDGEGDNLPQIGSENETSTTVDVVDLATPEVDPMTMDEVVIPEIEPVVAAYVKIDADALNVRRNATMDAEVLAKVYDKQIYKVLESAEDIAGLTWYQLEAPGDIVGWVSSDYCIGAATYEELVESIE